MLLPLVLFINKRLVSWLQSAVMCAVALTTLFRKVLPADLGGCRQQYILELPLGECAQACKSDSLDKCRLL